MTMHEKALGPQAMQPSSMDCHKPDDFDSWSKKDQDDYNRLMAAFPGTELISMKTLKRVSTRVLGEVAKRYVRMQFDEAYEEEYQAIHPPSMKDKIQRLLDQIKRDFPDGCGERDCSTCPLEQHPTREGVLLCDMLVKLHTGEM